MMDMEQTLNNWKFIMACHKEESKKNAHMTRLSPKLFELIQFFGKQSESKADVLERLLAKTFDKMEKIKNAGK